MKVIRSSRLLFALLLALFVENAPLPADTQIIHPNYARPEDVESVVKRTVPKAGVASMPSQNAVIVSGPPDVLEQVARLVRELDAPNQVVELEIGFSTATRTSGSSNALGATLNRARANAAGPSPEPSELKRSSGSTASSARQTVLAMPGSPVELFVGETILHEGGPLSPPLELPVGKKVKIESLRVVDDGKGAEMDVIVENTVPGAPPVVSSGTHAKTAVRLLVGQTQAVATHEETTSADTGTTGGSSDRDGARGRTGRTRLSSSSAGMVTITLKCIR